MSNKGERPEPEKDEKGLPYITEKFCSKLCEYNGYYYAPHLNANLHLHFKGLRKIENLQAFVNIRALYLENNCIGKIENLSHMKNLSSL
jgi:dynein assembly factor 1